MLSTNFLLQKIKKGSNSVNSVDRVMVFALCNPPYESLSSNYLQYFKRYAPDKSVTDGRYDGQAATICSPFGEHKKEEYMQ